MLSAFSPYCKRQLEAGSQSSGRLVADKKKAVTITGGDASAQKDILRFFSKYCDDKNAVPLIGNPELLGYFKLHEATEIVEVELLTGWAMVEAGILLEKKVIHPTNFSTVVRKYEVGRYVDMLMETLACAVANWRGGYSTHCRFIVELRKKFPDFWADVKVMVDSITEALEQELNDKA